MCAHAPNLVCLLCRGGMSLCVLVRLQQQVHQSWNSTCLPQWCLISWTQCQVPDQTNSGLRGGQRSNNFLNMTFEGQCGSTLKATSYGASKLQCQLLFRISAKYIDIALMFTNQCVMFHIKGHDRDERKKI